VVLTVNLLSAAAFGEFEFWAALLKVTTIVVFLLVGLVVVVGGFHIGSHRAGFQNLWNNPGGFWASSGGAYWYGPILVMSGVVFAYAAIEMVAIGPTYPPAGQSTTPESEAASASPLVGSEGRSHAP
jgi:L-asparagine permease